MLATGDSPVEARVISVTAPLLFQGSNSIAHMEASMLLAEDDVSIKLTCSACGGPILPGQPFIYRDSQPIHSESADCHPEEGWNPHMDTE